MNNKSIYACAAIVVGGVGKKWVVLPQIREVDGTNHKPITVTVRDGMTPTPGDTVLVEFMRNNLDLKPLSRVFDASESNGVIIGILKTSTGYVLTGDYTFIGNMILLGNLTMTGNLTITGDAVINGISFNAFHAATVAHVHLVTTAPGTTGPATPPIP